jgi:autotransporter-associated beta strand protein
VSVTVTDDDGGVGTDTRTVDITWVTFRVQDFTPTASGCDMRLIRPLDTSVLNLYDGEKPNGSPGDYGTPDLTVVGSTVGQVVGSLVWDAAARTARFVKTGGLLAPDTYTVTLASRSDGWKDLRGETLDGNADGVEALTGDDYVTTFTVSEAAGAMVGLPDFARGPGQTVNVPATGTGLPIRITGGTGATSVSLELAYNPADLTVADAVLGPAVPAGWSIGTKTIDAAHGRVTLAASGNTALGAGWIDLFRLTATVPNDAVYGAAQVLRVSSLALAGDSGPIAGSADDAVHKVAFLGDVTGNRGYSGMDAALIARIRVGSDTGFHTFPLLDPVIVGDTTANGTLSGLDASYVARKWAGHAQPEIPDLPAGNVEAPPAGGLDPIVTVGNAVGAPGDTVHVPVTISDAAQLQAVDLVLGYDAALADLANADVALGDVPAGWTLVQRVDDAAGTIRACLYNTESLGGGNGTLLDVSMHVPSSAALGSSSIDILTAPPGSKLNEANLEMTPVDDSLTVAVPGVLRAGPNDWAGGRLTLVHGGDGWLHLYRTGTAIDAIRPLPPAFVTSIEVAGRNDADDELTIDFRGGNPIPVGGVSFDGGQGLGRDGLVIADAGGSQCVIMKAETMTFGAAGVLRLSNTEAYTFDLGEGAMDLRWATRTAESVTLVSGSMVHGAFCGNAFVVYRGTIEAGLSGSGGLTKLGSGTATLEGPADYDGGTAVEQGQLLVMTADSLPARGDLTIGAGATLALAMNLVVGAGYTAAPVASAAGPSHVTSTPAATEAAARATVENTAHVLAAPVVIVETASAPPLGAAATDAVAPVAASPFVALPARAKAHDAVLGATRPQSRLDLACVWPLKEIWGGRRSAKKPDAALQAVDQVLAGLG